MSNLELKVEKKMDEKSVEGIVSEKEITEASIEKSLNFDELSKEEKAAIEEFNKKLDLTDTTQILQYGVAAQEKISKFSDSIPYTETVQRNISPLARYSSRLCSENSKKPKNSSLWSIS